MATILVDYENVSGTFGLTGVNYLRDYDDLCIFYSGSCLNMRKEDSNRIEQSGCTFRIRELKTARKNALDFYIATEAGIAITSGVKQIIIVSKDKGLQSVRDYIKMTDPSVQVLNTPTIESGLEQLIGLRDRDRQAEIKDNNLKIKLSDLCARIDERNAVRDAVINRFSDTDYAEIIPDILSCVERVGIESKMKLYRGSLHVFGRESGTVIYNMLKQVV